MALLMRVANRRCLPGCAGGLAERTALVEVDVAGDTGIDAAAAARLRAGALGFCPDEPLLGVGGADWPGAFLTEPVESLGGWVVALTVAVQRWCRDAVWRGRVLAESPDRLRLAIPWQREALFAESLDLALNLIGVWASPEPDEARSAALGEYFRRGADRVRAGGLLVDTLPFIGAAVRRGIPFDVRPSRIQFGWGTQAEFMDASFTSATGHLAAGLAKDKAKTIATLADAGVPVPPSRLVADPGEARQVAREWGWPVVVKPLNQDDSIGVVPGIRGVAGLDSAYEAAAAVSPGGVVVEKHVDGDCHRLLVVHGTVLAVVRRVPGGVVGDGAHTIAELVAAANGRPPRSDFCRPPVLDDTALEHLAGQGMGAGSVPEAGRSVRFGHLTFRLAGGYYEDAGPVHPDNAALAVRVTRVVGLDIAGVDLLTTDITRSWRETGAVVNEVNSQPSLVPHWIADPGRDINGEVLDILFAGRSGRIPTAAVTGGGDGEAAAVAGLVHRMWTAAGVPAGVCTRRGVHIGAEVVAEGDYSGLKGIRILLNDPGVGAAVFEVPAAGVAESGHGCDRYDVVGVLGAEQGCEDPVSGRAGLAVVSRAGDGGSVLVRTAAGERSVSCRARQDGRWIVLAEGGRETAVLPVRRIDPAGDPEVAVFAAAVAWAQGVDPAAIAAALDVTG